MHHGGYVQFAKLFVKWVPGAVGQRGRRPMTAGRIGIQIAPDEAELIDAAFEFRNAGFWRHAGTLRQLAHPDEILREQVADPLNAIVGQTRPFEADPSISDMVPHARGAWRKQRERRTAFFLYAELIAFHAGTEFIVRDAH